MLPIPPRSFTQSYSTFLLHRLDQLTLLRAVAHSLAPRNSIMSIRLTLPTLVAAPLRRTATSVSRSFVTKTCNQVSKQLTRTNSRPFRGPCIAQTRFRSSEAGAERPNKTYSFEDVRSSACLHEHTLMRWAQPILSFPHDLGNLLTCCNGELQIRSLSTSPSPDRILIDVREPAELKATGRIPGAQNMPIKSSPDGLFLPAEDFEDKFGFPKPKVRDEVIFYCKAGVRSRTAAGLARMGGWEKVGEYPGSWDEWEGKGGRAEKS